MYKLTSKEDKYLMAIASADSSIMKGYACSLLALCTGYECQTGDTVPVIYQAFTVAESNENAILEKGNIKQENFEEESLEHGNLEPQVYPNPSGNGEFTIDWTTDAKIVNVIICDATGRIHEQFEASNQTGHFTKTVNSPGSGVYFVTLSTKSGVRKTVKVVSLIK